LSPSSLSLLLLYYNPLFSLPTTLSVHSHPLFPLSSPSLLILPNLSPYYPSLLQTHLLTDCLLYQLHTTSAPTTPDTSTLHYINKNTCKHTQWPQNPEATIPLNPSTHSLSLPLFSATFTNSPKSIASLITINSPTPTVYRYFSRGFLCNTLTTFLALKLWTCYC
jgi:hypothetical protein